MHIQIEGCEASGKSTLIEKLKKYYQTRGYLITSNHFPTSTTKYGELAHEILNNKTRNKSSDYYITLLCLLDQKYISEKYINVKDNPRLLKVDSRGVLSTLVYSNLKDANNPNSILAYYELIHEDLIPDLIIYLCPNSDIVTSRLKNRRSLSIYDQINLIEVIKNRYSFVIDLLKDKLNIITISINNDEDVDQLFHNTTKKINEEFNKRSSL